MPRAKTKSELLDSATSSFDKLRILIEGLTDTQLDTPFDFSADLKKKEAHWSRDKNLRDVLIHLYEWHQLVLNWVAANTSGISEPFLPRPYNWRSYAAMNEGFVEKHQETSLAQATQLFQQSHTKVMDLARTFTDDELFQKGSFPWVGGSTLGSYFISATTSHYEWAIKKIRAHKKRIL